MCCFWLYRKFFGAKNATPQQQTKLSFATKARGRDNDDVNGDGDDANGHTSAKENADPEQGSSQNSFGEI